MHKLTKGMVAAVVLCTFAGDSMAQQPTSHPAVEWRFDQAQTDWKATPQWDDAVSPATLERTGDGLRVMLDEQTRVNPNGRFLAAGIHVNLPDWNRGDWAEVVVRVRAVRTNPAINMGLRFNLRERPQDAEGAQSPYQFAGENTFVARDDSIRTYRLRADWSNDFYLPYASTSPRVARPWQGPWRQLALWFSTDGKSAGIEIISVSVVPKGALQLPEAAEWRFDRPQPDWKPTLPNPDANLTASAVRIERRSDALRMTLLESSHQTDKLLHGGIYVDLDGWRLDEWARMLVRVRTRSAATLIIGLHPWEAALANDPQETFATTQTTFATSGGTMPILNDGLVHTYEIVPDWSGGRGPWLRFGLYFTASEPGSIDILSVRLVPIT